MGERQKETERPHNWSENVFPSSKTCRELHWNSCWKHQELWTLVGATLRGRPSGALKCTPRVLLCRSLHSIQTCLVFFLTQYLSFFSFFASFLPQLPHPSVCPPLGPTLPFSHPFSPIRPPLQSQPSQTSSCLLSPSTSYPPSTGVRGKRRRRRRAGRLNASTMTGAGSGCLTVSNDFFITGV